jgi:hypothetical protein
MLFEVFKGGLIEQTAEHFPIRFSDYIASIGKCWLPNPVVFDHTGTHMIHMEVG